MSNMCSKEKKSDVIFPNPFKCEFLLIFTTRKIPLTHFHDTKNTAYSFSIYVFYFSEAGTVRGSPGQTWCSSASSRSCSSSLTWSTGGACSAGGATPGRCTTLRTDTASTLVWGPEKDTLITLGSLWGMTPETRGLYSCHENTIMLLSESGKHRNIDICTRNK